MSLDKSKLESKITQSLQNNYLLRQLITRDFKNVHQKRRSDQFFKKVYERLYDESELEGRKFLNIGPGSFQHPFWSTADKVYKGGTWTEIRRGTKRPVIDFIWDIYDKKALPITEASFNAVYSSHVIEHAFDDDVEFLFGDVKRILKPNGTFRIVVPDAELIARAYKDEDWFYIIHYLCVQTGRRPLGVCDLSSKELREICSHFILDWVSLLVNKDNSDSLTATESVNYLSSFEDIREAFSEASNRSSRKANRKIGAHVNWFDYSKTENLLKKAGFSNVELSGYLKSSLPILRDRYYFDKTDPEMSLFIEARA